MQTGDIVRPYIDMMGLKAKQHYRVTHVEETPFGYTLAYLADDLGAPMAPVENAHLVLELVKPRVATKPSRAAVN